MAKLVCLLSSDSFRDEHRAKSTDFTRNRSLTLPTLVAFMLQLRGGEALQGALDSFFMALRSHVEITREVTKSAFCQARKKIKVSAFIALNRYWVDSWHEAMPISRWHGLRVVAADGTCVRATPRVENIDAYGLGPRKDGSVVMARCVALFSTASRQFLATIIGRYEEGERALLMRALGELADNDLLVLDRGYPAWWLFAALTVKGINFCVRIEGCGWSVVKKLMNSSQNEMVIDQKLNADARKELRKLGLCDVKSVKVRLVKVLSPNGKIEVLATSLQDVTLYPASDFGHLYRKRWAIEEGFKTVKHHLNLEGFSGELQLSIDQEIQAKMLMYNINLALCAEAQSHISDDKSEKWQVNHAYALKHLGRVIVAGLKGDGEELMRVVRSLLETLTATLEKVRPNRNFPRRHSIGGAQRPRRAYR